MFEQRRALTERVKYIEAEGKRMRLVLANLEAQLAIKTKAFLNEFGDQQ